MSDNTLSDDKLREIANLVMASDPNSALDLWGFGDACRNEGRNEDAEVYFRDAIKVAELQELELGIQIKLWLSLGRTLADIGKVVEAEQWLRKAVTTSEESNASDLNKSTSYRSLARLLTQIGREDEAKQMEAKCQAATQRIMEKHRPKKKKS